MANIKSAKKQAKKNIARRAINLARMTGIKNAIKKVLGAINSGISEVETRKLLSDATAKLARSKGKNLLHANTVSRKISRLSKKVEVAYKSPVSK